MSNPINRNLFSDPVESFATSLTGNEAELSGLIVANANTEGDLVGKENSIVRIIGGVARYLMPEEISFGTQIWVKSKGKNYTWGGVAWTVGGQERVKIEEVEIDGNKITLSAIPSGDLIQTEIGYVHNGTFYSLKEFESVKEADIEENVATLSKEYTDKFARVVYTTSGQAITTAPEPFTPDTTIAHDEDTDGVTLTNVPDTNGGELKFVNLNSGENLVDNYGGQAILTVDGTPVAQVDYVTAYNGKTFHYVLDGITYVGTFSDNTANGPVVLVEVV